MNDSRRFHLRNSVQLYGKEKNYCETTGGRATWDNRETQTWQLSLPPAGVPAQIMLPVISSSSYWYRLVHWALLIVGTVTSFSLNGWLPPVRERLYLIGYNTMNVYWYTLRDIRVYTICQNLIPLSLQLPVNRCDVLQYWLSHLSAGSFWKEHKTLLTDPCILHQRQNESFPPRVYMKDTWGGGAPARDGRLDISVELIGWRETDGRYSVVIAEGEGRRQTH